MAIYQETQNIIKQDSLKHLNNEFRMNMTITEQLKMLLGDENSSIKTIEFYTNQIEDVRKKLLADNTRTPDEKLLKFREVTGKIYDGLQHEVTKLAKNMYQIGQLSSKNLFANKNSELTGSDVAVLNSFIDKIKDGVDMSTLTESEARLLVNVKQNYPHILPSDVQEDIDMGTFNSQFSPEAYNETRKSSEAFQLANKLAAVMQESYENVAPSTVVEEIKSKRFD